MRGTWFARLLPVSSCLLVAMLGASAAGAQTVVVNPTAVEFTPSTDHATLLPDGSPVVDHYSLDIYSVGATQPFQSASLGKPDPLPDGFIHYDFSAAIASWPLPGGNYEARVAAVGGGGSAQSDPSNPFTFASCSYALSGSSATLPAAGGGTQVGVTTSADCSWTAQSNAAWAVASVAGGTGPGTVVVTVSANSSTSPRTATLTVAGQPFTITEQGAAALPGVPSGPAPADQAAGVGSTPALSWSGTGATSYSVRFGTANPPPQVASGVSGTGYVPGTLAAGTAYYWQVVAVNAAGSTAGPVWTFKTAVRKGRKK